MRKMIQLFILSLLTFTVMLVQAASSSKVQSRGKLTVVIDDLKDDNGVVRVVLYNSEQAYQASGRTGTGSYRSAVLPIHNKQAKWHLRLPAGEYAIKLFHDEDSSGKLKFNTFGIPEEEIGFSNNPSILHGAPSYDKTKFTFNGKKATIQINVINKL